LCLRWLAVRSRSRRELARRLRRHGVSPGVADEVLDRLQSVSLVDDDAFSRAYVRSRLQTGGRSRRMMRAELARRGVDPELADTVAAEELPADESASCEELAEKKARSYRGLERAVARRRLAAFLGRRGFSSEDVFRAVDKALPEEE